MNNLFEENIQKGVTFTGHRFVPYKSIESIKEKVRAAVIDLYKKGYTDFYCGMAIGFDLLAAEVVYSLKQQCPSIKLIAAIPYRNQSERFSDYDKKRYNRLVSAADSAVMLREDYCQGCLLRRNDFMLSKSYAVIAYYNGTSLKGGTFYTVNKANKKGISVNNVF